VVGGELIHIPSTKSPGRFLRVSTRKGEKGGKKGGEKITASINLCPGRNKCWRQKRKGLQFRVPSLKKKRNGRKKFKRGKKPGQLPGVLGPVSCLNGKCEGIPSMGKGQGVKGRAY